MNREKLLETSFGKYRPRNKEKKRRENISCFFYGFFFSAFLAVVTFFLCEIYWRHIDGYNTSGSGTKNCQKRVIAYYNGWDERKITEGQLEQLTHIIFDGIKVTKDGSIEYNNNSTYLRFFEMKHKARIMNTGIKLMFSTDSHNRYAENLLYVLADSELRKNWISAICSFILEQELDGVELHYLWPETKTSRHDYAVIARELRYELEMIEKITRRKTAYLISVFAPSSSWTSKSETILDNLLLYVDFLNVETDDYYGSWKTDGLTGPLSPLYSNTNHKSVDWTMKEYTCKTQKPSQLNFIVSFRGCSWEKVRNGSDILYTSSEIIGGGTALPWRYLAEFGWDLTQASWHEKSNTPYVWDENNRRLLTFDNYQSLKEKVKYMVFKNLGGLAIHHIELDDDANTLLSAVTSFEECSKGMFKKDEIKYNC